MFHFDLGTFVPLVAMALIAYFKFFKKSVLNDALLEKLIETTSKHIEECDKSKRITDHILTELTLGQKYQGERLRRLEHEVEE